MPSFRWRILWLFLAIPCRMSSASLAETNDNSAMDLPRPGAHQLLCITPDLLELTLITTKRPNPAPCVEWNFIGPDSVLHLPATNEFKVMVAGTNDPVISIGFKRRVLYAPLKKRDLRIGNYLYLRLANPVVDGQTVEVKNPDGKLWPANQQFAAVFDPLRWSPAIHANQVGYQPDLPKKAKVGYYLGSLGEMDLSSPQKLETTDKHPASAGDQSPGQTAAFKLIEAGTGRTVFQGKLIPRQDVGFDFPTYQQVLEADFSDYKIPGEYRLLVPGLGVSFPFFINDGAAAFARTYAWVSTIRGVERTMFCHSHDLPMDLATSRPPRFRCRNLAYR